MNKNYLFLAFCCFVIKTSSAQPEMKAMAKFSPPKVIGWKAEAWTQSDVDYLEIQKNVDSVFDSRHPIVPFLKKARDNARTHRNDPKAWFKWAYTARRVALATYPPNTGEVVEPLNATSEWTLRSHSYQVTRLHYLLVYLSQQERGTIIPTGERLLSHNPRDFTVKQSLIDLLSFGRTIEDRKRAVFLAKQLIHSSSSNASFYASAGGAYMGLSRLSHKKSDRDMAVMNYRQYLKRSRPDAPFRKSAKEWIRQIEEMR